MGDEVERVRVMWDWGAFPVWREHWDDDKPDLVISDALRADLQAWADDRSEVAVATRRRGPLRKWRASRDRRWQESDRRGRLLAERLQDELGGGFRVVYPTP